MLNLTSTSPLHEEPSLHAGQRLPFLNQNPILPPFGHDYWTLGARGALNLMVVSGVADVRVPLLLLLRRTQLGESFQSLARMQPDSSRPA
jgi:hypothetical protein